MSETIEADQMADRLWELLDRVEAGESFLIVRNGVPLAQLVPYRGRTAQQEPGEHEETAAG